MPVPKVTTIQKIIALGDKLSDIQYTEFLTRLNIQINQRDFDYIMECLDRHEIIERLADASTVT